MTKLSFSLRPATFVAALSFLCAGSAFLRAAEIDLSKATIPELEAAMAQGSLTSEQLTREFLARIAAYDKQGPAINALITLNPNALEVAKALDAERKAKGPRSPIHGIPVILKDNYNTYDLQTTAGCQLLAGSIPSADAFIVKKLRDAGAVILAKANLSEFAAGGSLGVPREVTGQVPNGFSSMGGQTHNPHDLTRGPSGSSGGTGASIAAFFAQFGTGSDTGGSIRGPSSANGIVGLKPTRGLLSRSGIVPLALSFDTGGPMARSVTDIAVTLGIMTGVDANDPATFTSAGRYETDYTKYLKVGSLKGARIGVARDFMGRSADTDQVIESAIATLKSLGAEVIDPLKYPDYVLQTRTSAFMRIVNADFKAQIAQYLATLKPGYPKTLAELAEKANDPKTGYTSPEKALGLKYTDEHALSLKDPDYIAIHDQGLELVKAGVLALFSKYGLDAIVYPTSATPATLIKAPAPATPTGAAALTGSATNIANETGFPDLIVPAGMTKDGLPVTLSFFGVDYSEPKLIAYGYDFEQATKAYKVPKYTPKLPGDVLQY